MLRKVRLNLYEMENVLLFVLSFGAIPFMFFVCFQIFTKLMNSISAEENPELEDDKWNV
jgi:hypothetical protein